MSDITNSIRLNDYMSSTLRTINHTMEQTIRIMEKLGRSLELLESSSQGGFRNLENGLKAIMARAAMLQEMIKSIGTGAGPSRTSLAPFQASLRIIQNQAAALAKQMENLNGFKGNNPLVPFIRQFEKALATAKQLTNAIKSITIANDPASTAYFNLLTQQINEVKQQIGGLKAMLAQINSTATAISSPFEGWTDQLRLLNHLPKLEKSLDAVKRLANAIGSISIANDSANTAYFNLLTQQINEAKQQINDLKAALSKVNNTTEAASNPFEGWMEKLKVLDHIPAKWKTAMEVLSGMGQIMGYAEIYADANAELDAINDGHRTQLELQRQVLRMANETGSSYLTSAAQVAQLGDTAQFQGKNDRTVRFVDIVYKSSILSGADSSETADVMNLLSQAMASGTLKGEGFNAVLAKSSKLAEAMAAALGVDITTLRQMAMEGTLTAATVAEAVLRQGEVIDAEFAKLPTTFGQNLEVLRNIMGTWLAEMAQADGALGRLNDVLKGFLLWLRSGSGETFLDGLSGTLLAVVRIVERSLFPIIVQIGLAIQQLFPVIAFTLTIIGLMAQGIGTALGFIGEMFNTVLAPLLPLLAGLIAGFIAYQTVVIGIAAVEGIAAAATAAWTTIQGIATMAMLEFKAAVDLASLAQLRLNLALFGSPIGFVIGLIALLIGVLVYFIMTNQDVFVKVMSVWYGILNGIDQIGLTIRNIFYGLLNTIDKFVLRAVEKVEELINKALSIVAQIPEPIRALFGLGGEIKPVDITSTLRINVQINQQERFNKMYQAQENMLERATKRQEKLDEMSGSKQGRKNNDVGHIVSEIITVPTFPSITDIGNVDKVNKVGQIDDDVNIADEDLKMLMELAVQNRVNQINLAVQTAAPNVTQNNIINNEMDIQAVANEFATSVYNTSQVMVEQDY